MTRLTRRDLFAVFGASAVGALLGKVIGRRTGQPTITLERGPNAGTHPWEPAERHRCLDCGTPLDDPDQVVCSDTCPGTVVLDAEGLTPDSSLAEYVSTRLYGRDVLLHPKHAADLLEARGDAVRFAVRTRLGE